MGDITITFFYPLVGSACTLVLDDTHTAEDAISALVAHGFIPARDQDEYGLVVNDGPQMRPHQTFASAGVKDLTEIRVVRSQVE